VGRVAVAVATSSTTSFRSPAPGALLHYSSDPGEPLLNAASRVKPLPDAPAPRPVSSASRPSALGLPSDYYDTAHACDELNGSNRTNA